MILRVGRESFDLSLPVALNVNNRMAVLYKESSNPERRREIVDLLYQLNIGLFRSWKIYDYSQQADYSQEAFFFISRALEKFQPGRGLDFLPFLKRYFVAESQRQYLNGQTRDRRLQETISSQPVVEAVTQEDGDALFWAEARGLVGEEGWAILEPCIFGGLTPTDVAHNLNIPIRTVNGRYNRAKEILRLHVAKRSAGPQRVDERLGDGDWLGAKKFCRTLDLTPRYLADWINPNRPKTVCPTYLDPRDVLRVQGIKIRYLFTAKRGLEYPRTIAKD